jgi:hypothetical protein
MPEKDICNCDQALEAEAEVGRLRRELAFYRAQLAELYAALMEAERPDGRYAKTQRLVRARVAVRNGA